MSRQTGCCFAFVFTFLCLLSIAATYYISNGRDWWTKRADMPYTTKPKLFMSVLDARSAISREHKGLPIHLQDISILSANSEPLDMDDEFSTPTLAGRSREINRIQYSSSTPADKLAKREATKAYEDVVYESEHSPDYENASDNEDGETIDQADLLLFGGGSSGGGYGYGHVDSYGPEIVPIMSTSKSLFPVQLPVMKPVIASVIEVPQPVAVIQHHHHHVEQQPQVQPQQPMIVLPQVVQAPQPQVMPITGGQQQQMVLPQQAFPQQTLPQQTFPQQTLPQQPFPQQNLPQQTFPQQNLPSVNPNARAEFPTGTFPTQQQPAAVLPQQQPAAVLPQQPVQQPVIQPAQVMIKHQVPAQKIHIVLTEQSKNQHHSPALIKSFESGFKSRKHYKNYGQYYG